MLVVEPTEGMKIWWCTKSFKEKGFAYIFAKKRRGTPVPWSPVPTAIAHPLAGAAEMGGNY